MRRILAFALILIGLTAPVALAQQLYTHEKLDYSFELPSPTWKSIADPDTAREHPEFVYGDRLDGYLTIRKEIVEPGTTPGQLATRDQDLKLRYLPGFVEGKQETFNGRLDGVTMSYEFVRTDAGPHLLLAGGQPHDLRAALYGSARQVKPDS
jgi:hypothetical protein